MLYRLASAAIVLFWVVMTLLLVRNEVAPEASRVREIPLAYVLKLVFMHEQPSDLVIYNGPTPVGSVRLQPRLDRKSDERGIDFSGDLRLPITAEQKARFNWVGQLEMSRAYAVTRSKWNLSMIEPQRMRMELEIPEKATSARFAVRTGEGLVITQGELPLGQGGAGALTTLVSQSGLGFDLGSLLPSESQAPVTLRARQSSLKYHGERTETYLLTLEQNGQALIEAHLSQLGQVLMAKTIIGYTFRPENFTP